MKAPHQSLRTEYFLHATSGARKHPVLLSHWGLRGLFLNEELIKPFRFWSTFPGPLPWGSPSLPAIWQLLSVKPLTQSPSVYAWPCRQTETTSVKTRCLVQSWANGGREYGTRADATSSLQASALWPASPHQMMLELWGITRCSPLFCVDIHDSDCHRYAHFL